MHGKSHDGHAAEQQRKTDCRTDNGPDTTLIHLSGSLVQPRRIHIRQEVRHDRDRYEDARAIDHVLVDLLGFRNRQTRGQTFFESSTIR
jgi:hypothetical protein